MEIDFDCSYTSVNISNSAERFDVFDGPPNFSNCKRYVHE